MMDIQKKIIIHSLQLFKSQGIKNVTMSDISKTLGMSKKTLYVHFANKKDLVNQSVIYLFDLPFSYLEDILKEKTTLKKKITKFYNYAIDYLKDVSPIFVADLKKQYPNTYLDYNERRRKLIFELIKQELDKAQLSGEIEESIDTQLFCEFHLFNWDKILLGNTTIKKYKTEELFLNSVGTSLRGILKKC
jgi:AcrR family transcriptional regulator